MQNRRIVILGRLESGGTDPSTLRPLPDRLVDIRRTLGEFSTLGLQTQLVADVALRLYREKILVRTAFFARHTHIYSTNEAGEKTLFRLVTTQPHIRSGQNDANMIYLIVTEDNEQRIIDGFESAISEDII